MAAPLQAEEPLQDCDAQEENATNNAHFPPLLLALVPERSPLGWTVINSMLAVSGLLLVLDLAYANQELDERPFANAFNLLWCFVVCIFWWLEVMLSACYLKLHLHEPIQWWIKLELVLAAYFLLEATFLLFFALEVMANDGIREELIWSAIDTACYWYLAVRSCIRLRHSRRLGHDKGTALADIGGTEQEAATSSYQRMEFV
jgi:hypothetical protein